MIADEEEMVNSASALSFGIRAQKKLLRYVSFSIGSNYRIVVFSYSSSKFSSKSVAKIFIDETSGRILDNLHKLARNYSGKKDADKLLKSIIKTIVKIGILYKNELFTEHELKLVDEFRNRFHSLAKTVITIFEVDFKFDRAVLTRMCKECQDLTHKIISKHLTPKSHARVDFVFNYVSNLQFLEYSFNPSSTVNRAIVKEVIDDMHSLMDAGFL